MSTPSFRGLASCLLVSVVACAPGSGDDVRSDAGTTLDSALPDAGPPSPDTSTFDVTWAPTTLVIDQDHLGVMTNADHDNAIYTFDAAALAARGLTIEQGRVMAIYGEGILRATSVTTQDGSLVAHVEPAALTDAITDGTITWDHGIALSSSRAEEPLRFQGVANGGVVSLKFKDGLFDYDTKVTLQDASASYDFTISKTAAGAVKMSLNTKGSLQGFRTTGRVAISQGKVVAYQNNLDKLQGEATVTMVATGSGNDINYKRLVPMMSFPVLVGYVPVTFNMGAQFIVNATVPADDTANVSAKFSYDSDLGFDFDGVTASATSHVRNHEITMNGDKPYAGGSSQVGANFGVAVPHLDVKIGHKLVAEAEMWFHPAFLIGGSFTANGTPIPTCELIQSEFLAAVGWKVSLLAGMFTPLNGSKTVDDKKQVLWQSGTCP